MPGNSSAAVGIGDIGTLTALGHSASTFWAGSCLTLHGRRGDLRDRERVADGGRDLACERARQPRSVRRRRRRRPGRNDAAGGRFTQTVASVVPSGDGNDDRTRLAALLFACSAIIGAVVGAIGPRRQGGA